MVLAIDASLVRWFSVHPALTCLKERSRSEVWREGLEVELKRGEFPNLIFSHLDIISILKTKKEMEAQKG